MSTRGKAMLKASLQEDLSHRPKRRKKSPIEECHTALDYGLDPDGMQMKFINSFKGYGVFAAKDFKSGDFLLEYAGERITAKAAMKKEETIKSPWPRCFKYYFMWNGKEMCIDASGTLGRLGHMVNDAPFKTLLCNCKMRLVRHKNSPRLCLFALRDIRSGEEFAYDYGDGANLWWREENQARSKQHRDVSDDDDDPFDLLPPKDKGKGSKISPKTWMKPTIQASARGEQDNSRNVELDQLTFCGLYKEPLTFDKRVAHQDIPPNADADMPSFTEPRAVTPDITSPNIEILPDPQIPPPAVYSPLIYHHYSPLPTDTPPLQPTGIPAPLPPTDIPPLLQPTDIPPLLQPTDTPLPLQPTDTPLPLQPTDIPPLQPTDTPPLQPTDTPPLLQPTDTPPLQPTDTPPLQPTDTPLLPPTDTLPLQPTDTPPLQPTDTPTLQPTDTPPLQPTDTPPLQPTDTPPLPPTDTPPLPPTDTPPLPPTDTPPLQPTDTPPLQPTDTPPLQPTDTPPLQPTDTPPLQATGIPPLQPTDTPPLQPTDTPPLQATDTPPLQPTDTPPLQPTDTPPLQATGIPPLQATGIPPLQPTDTPPLQPTDTPPLQATDTPPLQATDTPPLQATDTPPLQPTDTPPLQPTDTPPLQATDTPPLQPTDTPPLQPTDTPPLQPTDTPPLQATGIPPLQPTDTPPLQPTDTPPLQATDTPPLPPTDTPPLQPTDTPPLHPSGIPPPLSLAETLLPPAETLLPPADAPLPPTDAPLPPTDTPPLQPTDTPPLQATGIPPLQPTDTPPLQPTDTPPLQPTDTPPLQPTDTPPLQPTDTPPLQATGIPPLQPTDTPPLHPTDTPPLQATGIPPLQATAIPPLQATGIPLPPIDTPLQATGIPLPPIDTPLQATGIPLPPIDTPLQATGIPLPPIDTPLQATGIPLPPIDTPPPTDLPSPLLSNDIPQSLLLTDIAPLPATEIPSSPSMEIPPSTEVQPSTKTFPTSVSQPSGSFEPYTFDRVEDSDSAASEIYPFCGTALNGCHEESLQKKSIMENSPLPATEIPSSPSMEIPPSTEVQPSTKTFPTSVSQPSGSFEPYTFDRVEDSDSAASEIYPFCGTALNGCHEESLQKKSIMENSAGFEDNIQDLNITEKIKHSDNHIECVNSVAQSKKSQYPDVQIAMYKPKNSGQRCYDKKHACYFCGGLLSKMARHLKQVHSNEPDVAKALAQEQVAFELERIRLLGNFKHNLKVLKDRSGELIVSRRPILPKVAEDYLPCIYCYCFIDVREIWRHVPLCTYNEGCEEMGESEEDKKEYGRHGVCLTTRCRMLLAGASSVTLARQDFKELQEIVLKNMRNGPEKSLIENDELILIFGSALLEKGGSSKRHTISTKMRQLARLLMVMRVKDPFRNLSNSLCGQRFDEVVEAAKQICGNPKWQSMSGVNLMTTPSLGLQLGHSLVKVAEIKNGQAIRKQNHQEREEASSFKELFNSEWSDKISSRALQTLKERKYNSEQLLPLTSDLLKVTHHTNVLVKKFTKCLLINTNISNWRSLSQAVFVALTLFNKRRGGEVARMHITSYTKRPKWKDVQNEEMVRSLNTMEKKLLERFDMLQLPGKRNRRVPMIIKPDLVSSMDLLMKTRQNCHLKSPYFFGIPGKHSHLNAWKVLNDYAVDAGCIKPELISSTNLRKYTATVTQVLALSEGELEWLSNHLGHHIDIHRQIYRQHESTVELAKVSKILLAVETGAVSKLNGRTLKDIDIDDIDVSLSDSEKTNNLNAEEPNLPGSKRKPVSVTEESDSENELELSKQPSKKAKILTAHEALSLKKPTRPKRKRVRIIEESGSEQECESEDTHQVEETNRTGTKKKPVPVIEESDSEQDCELPIIEESDAEKEPESSKQPSKIKRGQRIPWEDWELKLLKKTFHHFRAYYPNGNAIKRFIEKHPSVIRTPAQIRSKLQHLRNQE